MGKCVGRQMGGAVGVQSEGPRKEGVRAEGLCSSLCPGFLPHLGAIWLESVAAGMGPNYQRTPLPQFESHLVL